MAHNLNNQPGFKLEKYTMKTIEKEYIFNFQNVNFLADIFFFLLTTVSIRQDKKNTHFWHCFTFIEASARWCVEFFALNCNKLRKIEPKKKIHKKIPISYYCYNYNGNKLQLLSRFHLRSSMHFIQSIGIEKTGKICKEKIKKILLKSQNRTKCSA